jgi:uncharacterized protein (TIGR03067 family)
MKKTIRVLVLLSPLLLAADRAKTEATRAALRRLEGTWKLVSAEAKGQPAPEDVIKDLKWEIKGNRLSAHGAEKEVKLTFQLDATGKPKTIDVTNPARKETVQGIYELAKGRLRVCLAAPGEKRPGQFATKEDLKVVLFVFQREKK